jgi:hypothetical protein
MTLARLCGALDALGVDPTVEDVLDVLWLARLHSPQRRPADPAPVQEETAELVAVDEDEPATAGSAPPVSSPSTPASEPALVEERAPPEEEDEASEVIAAHLPRQAHTTEPVGAVPVRVPGFRALTGPLGLARGLRPLKLTCASFTRWEVDETATADRIAEEGVWLPAIRPAAERWLDLTLIIDESDSMVIWSQLVAEFRSVLAHSGAFADIRIWRLAADVDGSPVVRATTPGSRVRQPSELVDPRGRRVFLVVSDCLAAPWRNGGMRSMLAELGSTGPLAVVQPLPQRLWHRTGLPGQSARLRVHRAAQPNRKVQAAPKVDCPIPVLELTREWLQSWSALVTGRHAWTDLAVARPEPPAAEDTPEPPVEADTPEPPDSLADADPIAQARAKVQQFKQSASAAAYDLACHLSAVPLSLPIMRLVQRAKVPGSRPAHLAEVFLSGLLQRETPPGADANPDNIQYDFVPEVREVLLDTVTRTYAYGVLTDVAVFLSGRIGRPLPFPALLRSPEGPLIDTLDRFSRPFANVVRAVMAKFPLRPPPPGSGPSGDGARPEVVDPGERPVVRTFKVQPTRHRRFALSSRETGGVMAPRGTLQPMIFLGIGGEGGRIGAEVERALREEFCGDDGTKLLKAFPGDDVLPYQLPSCFQFVYADLDEKDMARQRAHASIEPRHSAAAHRNVHEVSALRPQVDSYPELAQYLRVSMSEQVGGWLPSAVGEPAVAPLSHGTGGLPTVGRAALFHAMRHGVGRVVAPIVEAISAIAQSAGHLYSLGGRFNGSCDVYVAFATAGGTGAGMFYDYLHLVDDVLARSGFRAQIYPLVVLPATDARAGVLNSAGVLVDLLRLIDQQIELMNVAELDARPDAMMASLVHPGNTRSRLRPTSVQSAFLFGAEPGAAIADIRHNVVTLPLLMSVYGLANEEMSFADTFVRSAINRRMPAVDGIGSRGASTVAVVTMTVPEVELAAVVADRLLAESIADLMSPDNWRPDKAARRFFDEAGITDLYELRAPEFPTPSASQTSVSVLERYFADTTAKMCDALASLREDLTVSVPEMAMRFDPGRAVRVAIDESDLFTAWRSYNGIEDSDDEDERLGFAGLVRGRRGEPPRPDGVRLDPPKAPMFRPSGLRRRVVPRSSVQTVFGELVQWYSWRSAREWRLAWGRETPLWAHKLDAVDTPLRAMVSAFTEHAYLAAERFSRRCAELTDQHGAVSYLLPENGDLDKFYALVLSRLRRMSRMTETGGRVTSTADVVRDLLGPDIWITCYEQGLLHGAQAALKIVLDRLRQRVREAFHWTTPGQPPLLPRLSETLATSLTEVVKFCAKLPELVPTDLTDDSHTSVRVQLFYPAGERNPRLEKAVENALPEHTAWSAVEMHPMPAENLTAVLLGTGIGLTQLRNVRAALRNARAATVADQPDDLMRWRQRLGPDDGAVTTSSRHAIILRGMLTAMWNGLVAVRGSTRDPDTVIFPGNGSPIVLDLGRRRVGQFSSWGWLLRAYEDWAIEASATESWTAADELLRLLPLHTRTTNDGVLRGILFSRPAQVSLAVEAAADGHRWASTLERFWTAAFNAALDAPFRLHHEADNTSLRTLLNGD